MSYYQQVQRAKYSSAPELKPARVINIRNEFHAEDSKYKTSKPRKPRAYYLITMIQALKSGAKTSMQLRDVGIPSPSAVMDLRAAKDAGIKVEAAGEGCGRNKRYWLESIEQADQLLAKIAKPAPAEIEQPAPAIPKQLTNWLTGRAA